MLLKNETGQNISTAVKVLKNTYENLHLMFSEMDIIAEKEGFICLTPKFLRWKSDSSTEGWLTNNFIKLYQLENHTSLPNLPDVKEGPVFCVEVDLEGEDDYPEITLAKLTYDFSQWTRMPGVSDHWIFWDIFRMTNSFEVNESNGTWTSKPYSKAAKKYWGLQSAKGESFPLINVSSAETIKTKIFDRLLSL